MKLFIYPQYSKDHKGNPYTKNLQNSLSSYYSVSEFANNLPHSIKLFGAAFTSDIIIVNWLERIAQYSFGWLQAIMCIIAIYIIRIKGKKIVWMFHNMHPHDGENKWSRIIQRLLFEKSSIIISHSEEAATYARNYASCPVYYKPHPVVTIQYGEWKGECPNCDIFIWGTIFPYKGIDEFLSHPFITKRHVRVIIIGYCADKTLKEKIKIHCSESVIFENRRADYNEIAARCKKSKFVLFPYIGDSISSSGALMDTIQMGGTPIGPNRGAFADLAKVGCCITYDKIEEVFDLVCSTNINDKILTNEKRDVFIRNNSWSSFASWLFDTIN